MYIDRYKDIYAWNPLLKRWYRCQANRPQDDLECYMVPSDFPPPFRSYNRRSWEDKRLGGPLGQVWLPSKRMVLGSDAGVWVHKVMKMTAHQAFRKDKDLKWRRSAETSPLLEIALFLRHKSQKARKMSFAKRLFCARAEGPQHQAWPREINSFKHFVQSSLF